MPQTQARKEICLLAFALCLLWGEVAKPNLMQILFTPLDIFDANLTRFVLFKFSRLNSISIFKKIMSNGVNKIWL